MCIRCGTPARWGWLAPKCYGCCAIGNMSRKWLRSQCRTKCARSVDNDHRGHPDCALMIARGLGYGPQEGREMEKFQYVVALAAVITGLGLSDVSVSLHRLLKRRAHVTWDWVPLALALYLSFVLMRLWYQLWSVHAAPFATGLIFTTVQVVQTLVLIL